MRSGRENLLAAARTLLAERPDHEPTTRELYEAAGVSAPTLYHHFGDKDGLVEAAVDEAFAAYLERKRAVPSTGDLVADFEAGWDMHVTFGVENPALYAVMFGRTSGRRARAARVAEEELRASLVRLDDAGLLVVGVEEALHLSTAMAVGCVGQLAYLGETADGPLSRTMRTALVGHIAGTRPADDTPEQGPASPARALLARLGSAQEPFTDAELALLRQWLGTLAARPAHDGRTSS